MRTSDGPGAHGSGSVVRLRVWNVPSKGVIGDMSCGLSAGMAPTTQLLADSGGAEGGPDSMYWLFRFMLVSTGADHGVMSAGVYTMGDGSTLLMVSKGGVLPLRFTLGVLGVACPLRDCAGVDELDPALSGDAREMTTLRRVAGVESVPDDSCRSGLLAGKGGGTCGTRDSRDDGGGGGGEMVKPGDLRSGRGEVNLPFPDARRGAVEVQWLSGVAPDEDEAPGPVPWTASGSMGSGGLRVAAVLSVGLFEGVRCMGLGIREVGPDLRSDDAVVGLAITVSREGEVIVPALPVGERTTTGDGPRVLRGSLLLTLTELPEGERTSGDVLSVSRRCAAVAAAAWTSDAVGGLMLLVGDGVRDGVWLAEREAEERVSLRWIAKPLTREELSEARPSSKLSNDDVRDDVADASDEDRSRVCSGASTWGLTDLRLAAARVGEGGCCCGGWIVRMVAVEGWGGVDWKMLMAGVVVVVVCVRGGAELGCSGGTGARGVGSGDLPAVCVCTACLTRPGADRCLRGTGGIPDDAWLLDDAAEDEGEVDTTRGMNEPSPNSLERLPLDEVVRGGGVVVAAAMDDDRTPGKPMVRVGGLMAFLRIKPPGPDPETVPADTDSGMGGRTKGMRDADGVDFDRERGVPFATGGLACGVVVVVTGGAAAVCGGGGGGGGGVSVGWEEEGC